VRAFHLAVIVAAAVACNPAVAGGQARVTLVTDSAQYTVRFVDDMYRATIGYAYTNRSGDAVSASYCRTPPPPVLEKNVAGNWVPAYHGVRLRCRSIPDFRIPAATTYRSAVHMAVAPRGRDRMPSLRVDSIPGTYRLRWALRAGSDPDVGAIVEAISNEFRLVEGPSQPTPPRGPTPEQSAERRRAEEERLHTDWANLARYRAENMRLGPPKPGQQRVVFMGNSITEGWAKYFDAMFPGKPYVGRGIGGQTTPQMVVRFRQDVIALKPAVVVILAGTNDIAGNTGPATLEMIEDNLASMADLAQASGIRVVLSSVLPVYDYPWKPGLEPAPKIVALNAWMKDYASTHGAVYLDYHTAMSDERGGLRRELGDDGVHPNEAGYRVMAPLAERAIAEALGRR
jgi:acyl-CoA thioesterase I